MIALQVGARLAATLMANLDQPDFSIRKTMSRALRKFSRTYPNWVPAWPAEHADQVSGLTRREPLKRCQQPE